MSSNLKVPACTLAIFSLAACTHTGSQEGQKHYPFTGKVMSIDAKAHTATIDGAAIPGYMEAMKMEYPVSSSADLNALHAGENISATVDVSADGSYSLSSIHPRPSSESGK